VHLQLEPRGTESPNATTDQAFLGVELAGDGLIEQPHSRAAHAIAMSA